VNRKAFQVSFQLRVLQSLWIRTCSFLTRGYYSMVESVALSPRWLINIRSISLLSSSSLSSSYFFLRTHTTLLHTLCRIRLSSYLPSIPSSVHHYSYPTFFGNLASCLPPLLWLSEVAKVATSSGPKGMSHFLPAPEVPSRLTAAESRSELLTTSTNVSISVRAEACISIQTSRLEKMSVPRVCDCAGSYQMRLLTASPQGIGS
jgi:hypothetical protein